MNNMLYVAEMETEKLFFKKLGLLVMTSILVLLFGIIVFSKAYIALNNPDVLLESQVFKKQLTIGLVSTNSSFYLWQSLSRYFPNVRLINTLDSALNLYSQGELNVILVIPENYDELVPVPEKINLTLITNPTDIITTLSVPSLKKVFQEEMNRIRIQRMSIKVNNAESFVKPLEIHSKHYFGKKRAGKLIDFIYELIVPFLVIVSSFISTRLFLLILIEEIDSKFFAQILMSPLPFNQLFIGKSLPYILFNAFQLFFSLLLIELLTGIHIYNKIFLVLFSLSLFSFHYIVSLSFLFLAKSPKSADIYLVFFSFFEILLLLKLAYFPIWNVMTFICSRPVGGFSYIMPYSIIFILFSIFAFPFITKKLFISFKTSKCDV